MVIVFVVSSWFTSLWVILPLSCCCCFLSSKTPTYDRFSCLICSSFFLQFSSVILGKDAPVFCCRDETSDIFIIACHSASGLMSSLPPVSFTWWQVTCLTFHIVSPLQTRFSLPSLSLHPEHWTRVTSILSRISPSLWSPVGLIRSLLAARCIATSRHVTVAPSSPVPSRVVDSN